MGWVFLPFVLLVSGCAEQTPITFRVNDTDFSKGRLGNIQEINIRDIEKFHGHNCDGLVVGALAMQQACKVLYPDGIIDRTNLRIVSNPSPCLTDVAVYVAGGRYQFNTFSVDSAMNAIYTIQRIDNSTTVSVWLNKGVKPSAIDSLGLIAIAGNLSPCGIDSLRVLEDQFTQQLYASDPDEIFTVNEVVDFTWRTDTAHHFRKIDILNKNAAPCKGN